jgi:hypothetical protein
MTQRRSNVNTPPQDPFMRAYMDWREASRRLALQLSLARHYGGDCEWPDPEGKLWLFTFGAAGPEVAGGDA